MWIKLTWFGGFVKKKYLGFLNSTARMVWLVRISLLNQSDHLVVGFKKLDYNLFMDDLNNFSPPTVPQPQESQQGRPVQGGPVRKSFFKHWSGVVVLVVLAALVTWGLLNLPTIIDSVQGKLTAWQTQREINKLQEPYLKDKIGGNSFSTVFKIS